MVSVVVLHIHTCICTADTSLTGNLLVAAVQTMLQKNVADHKKEKAGELNFFPLFDECVY